MFLYLGKKKKIYMFTAIATFIQSFVYFLVALTIFAFAILLFIQVNAEVFEAMNKDLHISAYIRLIKSKVSKII